MYHRDARFWAIAALSAMCLWTVIGDSVLGAGGRPLMDRIVARVNREIITERELLAAAMGDLGPAGERPPGVTLDLRKALDELIEERLLAQAAAEEVKEISDGVVATQVEGMVRARQALFPDEKAFLDALAKRGWDLEDYKQHLTKQQRRAHQIQASLARRVRVSDKDVQAFREERQRKGKSLVDYRLRQVFIALPSPVTRAALEKAEQRALRLLEQSRQGVPFEDLARKHSDDPNAKITGGDLGWIGEREMQPAILQAVRGLEEGRVSQPVRTERGIHVFRLERRRTAREMLFEQRMDEVRRERAAELRRRAAIKILLPDAGQ
jgi:peptidyl-prolyl cis-trans isomerase SurA